MLPDGTIEGFVGGVCATDTVRAQGLRLLELRRAARTTLLRITPEAGEPHEEEGLIAVGQALGYQIETGPGVAADAGAVLVASHGVGEKPVLRDALAKGVPYIGLIAGRKRGTAVLARVEGGERVRVPAGLDIGARTPGEVAVSGYAEIISLR
ncbi:XdhC family protein [Nonomuraea angiospora]|uniref:XdhC family protein n=1 Tax=Nonomuraea angiospora TaxID=46172 RepID=UPI00342644CC